MTDHKPQAPDRDPSRPGVDEIEPLLTETSATIIPRTRHRVSRADISRSALKVVYRLLEAGHQAFLVGGCIRDLLLGMAPKDFDVATDATPEQVQELFRNARVIGRRFRLVHVRFGREIIEVATFRSSQPDDMSTVDPSDLPSRRRSRPDDEPAAAQTGGGMILRDNVYGSVDDDAARRDFTINALYYTPADFCVYDFAGGLEDIERRQIRLIGDPEQRYREDPVRMLRAIRFASKLDFDIEPATGDPIPDLAELLLDIPPARLFDEVVKLLMHGQGADTMELLREYDLMRMLFPQTDALMDDREDHEEVVYIALENTDARIAEDRPVTPGFLFAALLWPAFEQELAKLRDQGFSATDALHAAADHVVARQQHHTSVPRRFTTFMKETWALQHRLERPHARRLDRTLTHPRFRAAYDLLVIRERAGQPTEGMGAWWTDYQHGDDARRQELVEALGPRAGGGGSKRKRRRRRKPAS